MGESNDNAFADFTYRASYHDLIDNIAPWSWQANIGMERQWTNAQNELTVQARGGGGVSYQLFNDDRMFVMVTGRIEYNDELTHIWALAPGVEAGYLMSWSQSKTLFSVSHYQFIDDIERTVYKLEHNWAIAKDHAIRLYAKRSINEGIDYDEFGLSLRAYF